MKIFTEIYSKASKVSEYSGSIDCSNTEEQDCFAIYDQEVYSCGAFQIFCSVLFCPEIGNLTLIFSSIPLMNVELKERINYSYFDGMIHFSGIPQTFVFCAGERVIRVVID